MDAFNAEPTREDFVRALLEETNTQYPPTDEYEFAANLGLEIEFFDDHTKYKLENRIKAFLLVDRRKIGVFDKLTKVQKRFSIFHEIGHFVLPGHNTHPDLLKEWNGEQIIADNATTLSSSSQKGVVIQEIEANQFAADCIFQLDNFDNYIASQDTNWTNIRLASNIYNASIEATARRWIECSSGLYALVAFNPVDRRKPFTPLEIMYTITSSSFAAKYFSGLKKGHEISSESTIFQLYHRLGFLEDEPEELVSVNMGSDNTPKFIMKIFSNSYRVFGILTPIES